MDGIYSSIRSNDHNSVTLVMRRSNEHFPGPLLTNKTGSPEAFDYC